MKRRPVPGVALAAALLAGCVEFVGPEEPGVPDLPAQMVFTATLVDGGDAPCADPGAVGSDGGPPPCEEEAEALTSTLTVFAQFFPGTDGDGWPRPVASGSLDVGGVTLAPSDPDGDGWYRYAGEWAVPPPARRGVALEVALPRPGPGATWPERLTAVLPGRAGPGRVRLATGEDLVLTLGPWPGAPSPPPTSQRWQLELGGIGPLFVVSSAGPPPGTFFIPAVWLPRPAGGIVNARLVLDQRAAIGGADGEDSATSLVRVEIRWTIEIEEEGVEVDDAV